MKINNHNGHYKEKSKVSLELGTSYTEKAAHHPPLSALDSPILEFARKYQLNELLCYRWHTNKCVERKNVMQTGVNVCSITDRSSKQDSARRRLSYIESSIFSCGVGLPSARTMSPLPFKKGYMALRFYSFWTTTRSNLRKCLRRITVKIEA